MKTFNQFPKIEFPESLIRLGFKDQSYSNDVTARADLALKDGNTLTVWVEPEAVEERSVDYAEPARFFVVVYSGEEANEPFEEIGSFESETEMLDAIKAVMP
jgi:hypothetical protein